MISVVAVASGNGYLPCMSETKYLRNGIRKRIPRKPPSSDDIKIWKKLTWISAPATGLVSLMMYIAGKVKMAPATITPELAPIDWISTFSDNGLFLLAMVEIPTAMIAIGIAASKT